MKKIFAFMFLFFSLLKSQENEQLFDPLHEIFCTIENTESSVFLIGEIL
jgi:hypothetical protein